MRQQPKLRLLLVGGLYDITTPIQAALFGLAHSGVPRERTRVAVFPSGHEVYDAKSIDAFNQTIRDFVTPAQR